MGPQKQGKENKLSAVQGNKKEPLPGVNVNPTALFCCPAFGATASLRRAWRLAGLGMCFLAGIRVEGYGFRVYCLGFRVCSSFGLLLSWLFVGAERNSGNVLALAAFCMPQMPEKPCKEKQEPIQTGEAPNLKGGPPPPGHLVNLVGGLTVKTALL